MTLMENLSGLRPVLYALSVFFLIFSAAGCTDAPGNTETDSLTAGYLMNESIKNPVKAHYNPGEITSFYNSAEDLTKQSLDLIVEIPSEKKTFENTMIAYEKTISDFNDCVQPLTIMGYVYPDSEISGEGMECEERYSRFLTNVSSRRDLYDALKSVTPSNSDEKRLYDVIIREFEKNGLFLSDEKLAHVTEMRKELSTLELRFSANLNNDDTKLVFSKEELKGVPESSLSSFEKTPAKDYIVTMKSPDYNAVMTYADSENTRFMMYKSYFTKQGEENTLLLEEALVLRQNIAEELGYESWADYKTDGRIAKNSSNVMEFLNALKDTLKEKNANENSELLEIKKRTFPDSEELFPWDVYYLLNIKKMEDYSFDEEKVREYFPLDRVLDGIFATYEKLFGVNFRKSENIDVWHPDVYVYEVSDELSGNVIGYLYLDLFPRDLKYNHFCAAGLKGRSVSGDSYNPPVLLIIGNFNSPGSDKPSLLKIDEISTLFHETGHAMHFLLTDTPYRSLSGFGVEMDFVETPSQAMEEWAYDPEILKSISGHYNNSSEKIPDALLADAVSTRNVENVNTYTRVLADSFRDMKFHTTKGPVNTMEMSYEIYEDINGLKLPDGIRSSASFGHVMADYDAGYYGYLWSKVYSMNIVDEFKKSSMTNRTSGMKFREEILARGNMEDGDVLLENFLGKKPNPDALNILLNR